MHSCKSLELGFDVLHITKAPFEPSLINGLIDSEPIYGLNVTASAFKDSYAASAYAVAVEPISPRFISNKTGISSGTY